MMARKIQIQTADGSEVLHPETGIDSVIGLPTELGKTVKVEAQNLTEEQKAQARTNIGATAPEIFWATYGTTTYAEVGMAISAGKVVFCKYTYSSCVFRLDSTSYQGVQYIFTAIKPSGELEYIRLGGDNRWHYEHTYLVESMTAQEVATAVTTAWNNVMGS